MFLFWFYFSCRGSGSAFKVELFKSFRLLLRPIIFCFISAVCAVLFATAGRHARCSNDSYWSFIAESEANGEIDRFIIVKNVFGKTLDHAIAVRDIANISGWYFAVTANRHQLANLVAQIFENLNFLFFNFLPSLLVFYFQKCFIFLKSFSAICLLIEIDAS